MRKTHLIVIAIVLFGIFGDIYFRSFFHTIGLIITGLFVLFLIIHGYMDHKGMFQPKVNKRDKEG